MAYSGKIYDIYYDRASTGHAQVKYMACIMIEHLLGMLR